jgi:hypothetical protein
MADTSRDFKTAEDVALGAEMKVKGMTVKNGLGPDGMLFHRLDFLILLEDCLILSLNLVFLDC